MRLLYFQGNGTLAFTDFGRQKPPPYAILSHTWGEEEVTFQDLTYGTYTNTAGFKKIAFCGEQAAKDGLKYFWVDTCSIDKSNLPELTRSINSMFRWYRNASKCYVYLADVSVPERGKGAFDESTYMEAFWTSLWFTRGWTLQELIAPNSVEFFSAEGRFLGDKVSLEGAITGITGIPADALRGRPLSEFSVDARFAWANHRETSEEEDVAYCLLGIFDVFMPLIYGEGEKVRKWIQSPDCKSDYNKARDARSARTGDWLHTESNYAAWKTELQRSVSRHQKRPPGFGKTVLSTVIIEDL
ncbi:heterokaryon incompatibility protein-domain-containing protein, partial [Pyrenochaeta sp. MPI-SDFR-AT-0127]